MRAFLSLFYKLLYHSFAPCYDLVAALVSLGRWQDWVFSIIPFIQSHNVLELGFGPGHLQHKLAQAGFHVSGLDESSQMAHLARQRLQKAVLPVHLTRGVASMLPFRQHSFDTVLATFPTEFIFITQALHEINRVLTPDGQLVILLGVWFTGSSWLEKAETLLYQITGQAPPLKSTYPELITLYNGVGFDTRIEFVERPHDRLLFLIAQKTNDLEEK
jgi:ubiquinone/menaquinone biosynthesis C-methylase UbiE